MLPYKHPRFFPQYARLYNAAASPASRLRSAGLVGNNQINALALIGQSAVGYCAGKPTEKSHVFWIIRFII